MVCSRPTVPSWLSAASRVDFDGGASAAMPEAVFLDGRDQSNSLSDFDMGFSERVLSATGAAFLSAIIVNPLDVAKVSLSVHFLFGFFFFLLFVWLMQFSDC